MIVSCLSSVLNSVLDHCSRIILHDRVFSFDLRADFEFALMQAKGTPVSHVITFVMFWRGVLMFLEGAVDVLIGRGGRTSLACYSYRLE